MSRYAWLLCSLLVFSRPSLAAPVAFCELASLPVLPLASDSGERLPPDELLNRVAQSYRGLLEFAGEDFSQERLEALMVVSSESADALASLEKFFLPVLTGDQHSVALNESLTKLGDWVMLNARDHGLTQARTLARLREVVGVYLEARLGEQRRTDESREGQWHPGVETDAGHVFEFDTRFPELGEAWVDPDGMLWGDVAGLPGGSIRKMSYAEALNYCQSMGAELPSFDDFIRLREYMGAPSGRTMGYRPQVLPNLIPGEFWSSTSVDGTPSSIYVFTGAIGTLNCQDVDQFRGAVRCIKRTR